MSSNSKPITQQRDLAKLPRALAPLLERPQWAVWRWTQKPDGTWQKPPFQAKHPDRHVSTSDSSTWSTFETALATVQTCQADGISYILTEDDPFAAIDLDHCRDLETRSIDIWAQLFLERGRNTYTEVTPSGAGCRIWGLANGGPLHRKFTLKAGSKEFEPDKIIHAELFRRTRKALSITGYRLDTIRELTNIDKVFDWAIVWGERRKAEAAAAEEAARATNGGNGFNSDGCAYSIDQIEHFVREGAPPEANRSELFHTIIGHYLGCGWDQKKIFEHLQQFPDGIGGRYLSENRLRGEISRSAGKYGAVELPWSGESVWTDGGGQPMEAAPMPQPQPVQPPPPPPPQSPAEPEDLELEDDELNDTGDNTDDDPEEDADLDEDEPEQSGLPQLFVHGGADPRPSTTWLVKQILPARGHGLLSGQWGTAKTFTVIDLAAAAATGQPFLGRIIKRQSGVLFIAAEGANQVRLRFDAVWKEKCGDAKERAPFCWYETAPTLLQKGSVEKLIAMARQAEVTLMRDFGLPLGLIIIDNGCCWRL
jgi:AAA domain